LARTPTPHANGNASRHVAGNWALVANFFAERLHRLQQWLDPRRDLSAECGYPSDYIDPSVFQSLFDREAIAARVCEVLPKECFQVTPSIYEDEDPDAVTPWEAALAAVCDSLAGNSYHKEEKGSRLVEVLRRADILSGVGTYGVILVGIDDDLPLDRPAAMRPPRQAPAARTLAKPPRRRNGKPAAPAPANALPPAAAPAPARDGAPSTSQPAGVTRNLTFLQVFPEYYCRVMELDQDERSPRFGLPTLYSITSGDAGRSGGVGVMTRTVHWTRVVHLVDGDHQPAVNDAFGAPRQRPVLNRLLDLRKIYGPDAEGYYKNGIAGWSFETHPDTSADLDRSALKDEWEEATNSLTRVVATEGGTFKPLVTPVADPRPHIEIQIEAICIKLGIPVRIFKGSERGELASSQDDAAWNDRLRERQNNYLTPRVICPVIDRLIALGVLPEPQAPDGYKVWWPDLESQGQGEKASVAQAKTTAIATFFDPAKQLAGEMAPLDFWSRIMGYGDDEARQIVEAAEEEKAKRKAEAEAEQAKQQELMARQAEEAHRRQVELKVKAGAPQQQSWPEGDGEDEPAEGAVANAAGPEQPPQPVTAEAPNANNEAPPAADDIAGGA
jgi:hypothetical protein